jgi:hypothetical protein
MGDVGDGLLALCAYLEMLNSELELKIRETQSDVAKMQEIADAMRPAPSSEPKENPRISRLISLEKGIDPKEKPEKPSPLEPFAQFEDALRQFNGIKALHREQYSRKFLAKLSSYTRTTPVHSLIRVLPCAKRLHQEFDRILSVDVTQPNAALRASLLLDRSPSVIESLDTEIESMGLGKAVDVFLKEKAEVEPAAKAERPIPTHFETIANFSEKQLSNLYRMRGKARRELILARIREKIEEVLIPFLQEYGDGDETYSVSLKLASQCFLLLSSDPRSYALISNV